MIPNKLTLHNFMCYRGTQEVDLTGMPLVCLTGDNGHGKSSVLDAITWALFGQARANRDDELITLGESDMSVTLDFELTGHPYRIERGRNAVRQKSSLAFWLMGTGETGTDMGGSGIRETQAAIVNTLHLDYDSFVNSCMLVQGRSDSFMVKRPAERKQVLADILGLGDWEQYEATCAGLLSAAKNRATEIEAQAKLIEGKIEAESDATAALESCESALNVGLLGVKTAQTRKDDAEASLTKYRGFRSTQAAKLDVLNRERREIVALVDALSADGIARGQLATIKERSAEIIAAYNQLVALRQAESNLVDRSQRHMAASKRVNVAEGALIDWQHGLEMRQQQATKDILRLSAALNEIGHKINARDLLISNLELLSNLDAALVDNENERKSLEAETTEVRDVRSALKFARDSASQRLSSAASLQVGGSCPTCGQGLSEEHITSLQSETEAEWFETNAQLKAADGALEFLARRTEAYRKEAAELQRKVTQRIELQTAIASITEAIDGAGGLRDELKTAHSEGDTVSKELGSRTSLHEERDEAKVALDEIGYCSADHAALRVELANKANAERDYQALLGTETELLTIERRIQEREHALTEKRQQAAALEAEVVALEAQCANEENERSVLRAAEAELQRAQDDLVAAQRQETIARQRVQNLQQLEAELKDLEYGRAQSERETARLAMLREAFGKRGVPALIIDSVLPEIQSEANVQLDRMTDGRMTVRLETLRDKVTGGGAIETLDVIIGDELGERPYELYSGGEAFRVNLALRIAISKLLTRRAGARLQTLIIDEGFGSQDVRGRELLLETINAVRQDFERVIVVTHIEELKDAFPARLVVRKGVDGSRVYVE